MIFEKSIEQLYAEEEQLRSEVASLSLENKNLYYSQELEQMKEHDTYNKFKCFFYSWFTSFLFRKMVAWYNRFNFVCCGHRTVNFWDICCFRY